LSPGAKIMKKDVSKKLFGYLWFNIADEYYTDEYWLEQSAPEYKGYWHLCKFPPLKKDFYDKGFIVASLSKKTLMAKLGCGIKVLNRAIKTLVDKGWIKINKDGFSSQCVYILGTHIDGNIKLFKDIMSEEVD